jgi:neutral ceramidase
MPASLRSLARLSSICSVLRATCAGFVGLLLVNASEAAEFRAGRAKVVITPPIGSVIGNSYGISIATGVASDLHAKAVVFESGGIKAAIVACDVISLRPEIIRQSRELIAQRTGVSPERVIIAATHCHAGPQMHPLFIETAEPAARQLSERYVETLPGMIAESVRLAEADLQVAKLSVGRGMETTVSFNRRFLLRDGTVKTNAGARNPNIVRAMGPIDPEVGVVYIESEKGEPLVTIVNFALHVAVVGGNRVSADYPHVLSEQLARVKGASMLTVFLNGMSGNINHVDVAGTSRLRAEAEAARIGTVLAAAVLKTYRELRPIEVSRLQAAARPVRVPTLPAPSEERLTEARATVRRHGKGATFPDVIRAWRDIDLAQYARDGSWPSEVQAIAFGRELAFVGYPGDSFVELGLAMKQNSPFEFTFVSEQSANGSLSYIPNERAFPEGSYEVDSARVAPGGGEVLATAAVRLMTEMFPRP